MKSQSSLQVMEFWGNLIFLAKIVTKIVTIWAFWGKFDLVSYRVLNSVSVDQYLLTVNVNSVTLKTNSIMLIPRRKTIDKFLSELSVNLC